tara:strand:+ start:46 stop:1317 length:1272 start_codon:yes stop_codon:yes gene_type:complete
MYVENEILINNPYSHYSCGYHDLSPFSPDAKYLVFCSINTRDFKTSVVFSKNNTYVDINLFEIDTKRITFLYKTKCYTTEQGVRINWIDNKRITINDLDKNKIPQFIIYNVESMKIERVVSNYFCHQIAGLKKELCVSFDYSQIHNDWPSYGFHHNHSKLQTENSLNIFNWQTNTLLHRFNLIDLESYKKYNCGFIVHPSISNDGKKIIFMHRIPIEDIIYSWLYYVDLNSLKLHLITEEKVTHFTWINNDQFLIYQRLFPKFIKEKRIKNYQHKNIKRSFYISKPVIANLKNRGFLKLKNFLKKFIAKISSGFVIYNTKNKRIKGKLISLNLLGIDGHPFFNRKKNKIYLDTYPNRNKFVEIYSIDLKKPLFAKKEKVLKGDWETKIGKLDAHLRVSEKGNFICIDEIFKQIRSIKIFKIDN